jgi:D-sedoheptulose 7-phosphate isomerase
MSEDSALQSLYPFLHGARQDASRMDDALLESIRQKAGDSARVKQHFFETNAPRVVEVARALAAVYEGAGSSSPLATAGRVATPRTSRSSFCIR